MYCLIKIASLRDLALTISHYRQTDFANLQSFAVICYACNHSEFQNLATSIL